MDIENIKKSKIKIIFTIKAVFRNFESDSTCLDFKDFQIKKLNKKEKNKLKKYHIQDNYAATKKFAFEEGENVLNLICSDFWSKLLLTMKLFKKGDLALPYNLIFRDREEMQYGPISKVEEMTDLGDLYIFKKEDISVFNSFRKKVEVCLRQDRSICDLAIRQFLSGGEKSKYLYAIMDKLINYITGLESLYLVENQELSYRLSLRASVLLGESDEETKKIFEEIKSFYNIRSALIHGSHIKKEQENFLCKNIYKCGDYLRRSILSFFDLSSKCQNIVDKKRHILKILDEAILCPVLKKDIQKSLSILKLAK